MASAARLAAGTQRDQVRSACWPSSVRGADWEATKTNLLRFCISHPSVQARALQDCNAFILRPRDQGAQICQEEPDVTWWGYQSYAPKFLARIYKDPTVELDQVKGIGYALFTVSEQACSADGFVNSGALGAALDNILGSYAVNWWGVVTKSLQVSHLADVSPNSMLVVRIHMLESPGKTVTVSGDVFDADGGLVYKSSGIFYKVGLPKNADMENPHDVGPEPSWVVESKAFYIPRWVRPPRAFQDLLDDLVSNMSFEAFQLQLEGEDRHAWDFGIGSRIQMKSFFSAEQHLLKCATYFGPATLGPPPANVNGGATLTALDEAFRRLVEAEYGPGTCCDFFAENMELRYKKTVRVESTALIAVRVVHKSLDEIYLAAELVASQKHVPLCRPWQEMQKVTSLEAAALFKRKDCRTCNL